MSLAYLLLDAAAGGTGVSVIIIPAHVLLAYLLGSIPFGYIIVRLRQGSDIRSAGSGNIGATNVARVVGVGAGALTLLLDAAKGYGAVWLAGHWTEGNINWMVVAAVAAIVGHLFPVWLKFRGGRGVATGLGVFLPICPKAALAAVALWVVVVLIWRYVSLGSIVAAAALPLLTYWLYAPGFQPPWAVSIGATTAALLILMKHRSNFARLMAGEEDRLKLGKHR